MKSVVKLRKEVKGKREEEEEEKGNGGGRRMMFRNVFLG
jgi:hypothetical protein